MSDPSTSNTRCQPAGLGAKSLLGDRRVVIGAAVAIGAAGLWFGWPWLVVAGVAPILVALAPCLVMCGAMCAIGACRKKPVNATTAPAVAATVPAVKDSMSS